MSINQRYKQISEWFGKRDSGLAREIEITKSSMSLILRGDSKPSLNTLANTIKRFPEINARWLLIGEGEMLETKDNEIIPYSIKEGMTVYEIDQAKADAFHNFTKEYFDIRVELEENYKEKAKLLKIIDKLLDKTNE